MPNTTQLSAGSELQGGKYRIEKVLGQGGFGITYEAEQVSLDRKVAVKEFFMEEYCNRDGDTSQVSVPSVGSREIVARFRTKFVKEAKMIAGLNNPHIVKIYDVFEENGTAYYVMEYHDKGSLKDEVAKRGALPEKDAVKRIREVADALQYLHNQNILHLDVKPGNILKGDNGEMILIDFGVSKCYDEEGEQTSSTPVAKSKGYVPSELYISGSVSHFSPATDIYSLGATFYYLVTGLVPPDASLVSDEGINLSKFADLSKLTRNAIEAAMQPRRKDRPQSIAEFLSMLTISTSSTERDESTSFDDVVNDNRKLTPNPIPSPNPKPSRKWMRWFFPCLIVAFILAGAGVWWYIDVWPRLPKQTLTSHDVSGTVNGYEYVDLGLSVKWATCNVGASSPSDYGDYYAWGETNTKAEYTYSNSITCRKSFSDISGNPTYDVARKKWGSSWRLPKKSEFEELESKCTWVLAIYNGHKGYKVTGLNGNSIFLPAAGERYGDSLSLAEDFGYYWSSTPDSSGFEDDAFYLHFYMSPNVNDYNRYSGFSVRPVSE